MGLGELGLAISFLIIVVLLLTVFVKAQIGVGWKLAIIAVAIWYSLLLYSIPNNFSGWAVNSEPPDQTIIIGLWVSEPDTVNQGGIYFWGVKYPDINRLHEFSLDPKKFVRYIETAAPRTYRIPYSKEFHEKLLRAQQGQKQEKGGILLYKKGMKPRSESGKEGDGRPEDDSGFTLKRLQELLPKVEPAPQV
jgi:hypothetical protein